MPQKKRHLGAEHSLQKLLFHQPTDWFVNTSNGCILGRVISDVSQAHRGFRSREHHTPQASSGDPAGVDQVPTHVPIATLDQSH